MNENLLNDFLKVSKNHQGPIPFSFEYNPENKNFHLLLFTATHGNEIGSIPPVLEFIEKIVQKKLKLDCKITIVIANPEAVKINKRFVEVDLNRSYKNLNGTSLEEKRALELSHLIKSANLFIDLHQTIEPTLFPFYVMIEDTESIKWAEVCMGAENAVVQKKKLALESLDPSQTEFAIAQKIPCFTLELSQKGIDKSAHQLCNDFLLKLVSSVNYKIKNKSLLDLPILKFRMYSRVYKEPFSIRSTKLIIGFTNFMKVAKDQVIGYNLDKEIKSPIEGVILFPKYPQRDQDGDAIGPLPKFLFEIATPI